MDHAWAVEVEPLAYCEGDKFSYYDVGTVASTNDDGKVGVYFTREGYDFSMYVKVKPEDLVKVTEFGPIVEYAGLLL